MKYLRKYAYASTFVCFFPDFRCPNEKNFDNIGRFFAQNSHLRTHIQRERDRENSCGSHDVPKHLRMHVIGKNLAGKSYPVN